jgi:hypothetical protein
VREREEAAYSRNILRHDVKRKSRGISRLRVSIFAAALLKEKITNAGLSVEASGSTRTCRERLPGELRNLSPVRSAVGFLLGKEDLGGK